MTTPGSDGGGGQEALAVVLTNRSTITCTVEGYPGIGLVSPTGSEYATTVQRGGGQFATDPGPSLIMLAPAAQASASLTFSTGASGCPMAASIKVTPPDETAALPLSLGQTNTVCAPHITALVRGSKGSPR